ncbi:MAG: 1-(5-phosphoribosyl)-5-((5-phosphoribosylamino)methylideneamino)imidazole-4-carboxamide isomerase [Candidatus Methanomethylicota archaeon]|uniref:1-(5-phosphoribosyl)-5-[(5-phosphoribosylamino)methylideneamino] imidazole-4-carboxamide isomerase n=1 Tax=Thermoproteota archaeon TaxID=2056631 RepID=A0A497ETT4_9CREN|nr:MAG: 1-(5-phosphoribosyl)-5-((5-phosphoribosylamino)methylideneamino)imidazole-4-carboxamide isomerase [Candidatus Verstraetearchaeota archaeon]
MLVVPAIDISRGKCVRFIRGRPEEAIVYYNDPVEAALRWADEGAKLLHVVDLDAAIGLGENTDVIKRIIKEASVKVQVGGGIRSFERAAQLLNLGAYRVVFGTLAFYKPEDIKKVVEVYSPEHVMVALDHIGEKVVVKGWREAVGVKLVEAAERVVEKTCAGSILATSVAQDGTLAGIDVCSVRKLIEKAKVPVYAAGGVSSLEDIKEVAKVGAAGVVVGRALYEKRFTLREALEAVKNVG